MVAALYKTQQFASCRIEPYENELSWSEWTERESILERCPQRELLSYSGIKAEATWHA